MEIFIESIVSNICFRNCKNGNTLVFIDHGYGEIFKSNSSLKNIDTFRSTINISILPFCLNEGIAIHSSNLKFTVRTLLPQQICFFVSTPLNDKKTLNLMKEYVGNIMSINESILPKVSLVTSVCQDLISDATLRLFGYQDDTKTPYNAVLEFLHPISASISYIPLFSVSLMSHFCLNQNESPLEGESETSHQAGIDGFFCLSSPSCRSIFPYIDKNLNVFDDIDLDGLNSQENILSYKNLAHDLLGTLFFEYGLNPSDHIFAMGSTSLAIGQQMQALLSDIRDLRQSLDAKCSELLNDLKPPYLVNKHDDHDRNSSLPAAALSPASIILIDRTEDLLTPCSHGNSSITDRTDCTPLAHRIYSTIIQRLSSKTTAEGESYRGYDLDMLPHSLRSLTTDEEEEQAPLDLAFSALSSLSLQCPPSILMTHHTSTSTRTVYFSKLAELQSTFMSNNEDMAKQRLYYLLRESITTAGGVLPPSKKRGFGAEVLILVQALLDSPMSDLPLQPLLSYNPSVCLQYQDLISLSLAVIEAMQRSSSKQFAQTCAWKCSYDVRTSREEALDCELVKFFSSQSDSNPLAFCFQYLISQIKLRVNTHAHGHAHAGVKAEAACSPVSSSISISPTAAAAAKAKANKKDKPVEDPTAGPVDLMHVFIQLIRVSSLFEGQDIDSSDIEILTASLTEYVWKSSPEDELIVLSNVNILPIDLCDCLIKHRALQQQDSPNASGKIEYAELQTRLEARLEDYIKVILQLGRGRTTTTLTSKGHQQQPDPTSTLITCLSSRYYEQSSALNADDAYFNNNFGVLARSLQAILNDDGSKMPIKCFNRIETSLQHLKRAGLGLLTKGLGRLGFSSAAARKNSDPHPSDNHVIVIFVVGGISFKEIGQIKSLLSCYNEKLERNSCHIAYRVLLGSNMNFVPEDILSRIS